MHDGSSLRLKKLHENYDPKDKANAVRTLMEAHANNEVLTGVFYIDTQKPTFIDPVSYTHLDVYKRQSYTSPEL